MILIAVPVVMQAMVICPSDLMIVYMPIVWTKLTKSLIQCFINDEHIMYIIVLLFQVRRG